jgi:predicted nucleotidyltransferase
MHPHPTSYPDLNAVLRELTRSIQAILGAELVGVYLQGSFAVGDFDPHSDVDYIIVIQQELTTEQVAALQTMHARIYDLDCPWAQHLEGSYFPQATLRLPPQPGEQLWYLDNGARQLIRSVHCNTLVVRWQLRQHGVVLTGPDPTSLLPPIPDVDLRREILAVIHDWGAEILANPEHFNNRFYQGFITLSFCRMLHSLHTGEIASKRCSAEWAKATLDPAWRDLIDRAWSTRPVPEISVRTPADPADFQRTLEFVSYITGLAGKARIV